MKRQLKYKCCNVKTSLFGKHLTSGCRPWLENAAGLSSLMAHVKKSKRTFGVFEQKKDDFLLMQMIARYQNAETVLQPGRVPHGFSIRQSEISGEFQPSASLQPVSVSFDLLL